MKSNTYRQYHQTAIRLRMPASLVTRKAGRGRSYADPTEGFGAVFTPPYLFKGSARHHIAPSQLFVFQNSRCRHRCGQHSRRVADTLGTDAPFTMTSATGTLLQPRAAAAHGVECRRARREHEARRPGLVTNMLFLVRSSGSPSVSYDKF